MGVHFIRRSVVNWAIGLADAVCASMVRCGWMPLPSRVIKILVRVLSVGWSGELCGLGDECGLGDY